MYSVLLEHVDSMANTTLITIAETNQEDNQNNHTTSLMYCGGNLYGHIFLVTAVLNQ